MASCRKPGLCPLLTLLEKEFPQYTKKEHYARVLCGEVLVGGECIRDPGYRVPADSRIEFRARRFVSRGGEKLQAALSVWNIEVRGKIILDAGSSSGGFTDCLLQNGAAYIYAVDVGYNQLDYRLRNNPAVAVYERTNIMSLHSLSPPPHGAVADLSFRSIRKAASRILSLTDEKWLIALIKPQYELAGSERAGMGRSGKKQSAGDDGFNGIISEESLLVEIVCSVIDDLWEEGAYVTELMHSPIKGRRGNREFLFYMRQKPESSAQEMKKLARSIIAASD